jgi:hypothetical protein
MRIADMKSKSDKQEKDNAKKSQSLVDLLLGDDGFVETAIEQEKKGEKVNGPAKKMQKDLDKQLGDLKQMYLAYNKSLQTRTNAIKSQIRERLANYESWIAARDTQVVQGPNGPQQKVEDTVLKQQKQKWEAKLAALEKVGDASAAINKEFTTVKKSLEDMKTAANSGSAGRIFATAGDLMFTVSDAVKNLGAALQQKEGPIDMCQQAAAAHQELIASHKDIMNQVNQKFGATASNSTGSNNAVAVGNPNRRTR